MKVVCFAGYSGAGKTTLVEGLIPILKAQGQRVSVIKHAHHKFDIDHPGKDSYRHREAGAFEVLVSSSKRLALIREFEQEREPSVHHLIAELYDGVDWVLVEGFRDCDLQKLEVWRAAVGNPARYPDDDFIVAIVTDSPGELPESTLRPLMDLNDPVAVAQWLTENAERFEYRAELYQ